MSTDTFAALGVSPGVIDALAGRGIDSPFPVQAQVLTDALAGRDVLVQSPTGSGKTLAFTIPLVERVDPEQAHLQALVLVPTRELATQVADELLSVARPRRTWVGRAYGGVAIGQQARFVARAQILVATPGRLEDLIDRRAVRLDRVTRLVLDEADRMLDMGFQPAVDRIVARIPKDRQTMFFSATLAGRVEQVAHAYTRDAARIEVAVRPRETGPIAHTFVPVGHDQRVDALVDLLAGQDHRSLVFVRTRHGADRLIRKLDRAGVRAVVMHGSKTQASREKALRRFADGEVRALVATDVAARGIDVDDVTHVINFDPPEEADAYVHRIGRTGRAGKPGTGITFVTPDQRGPVARIVEQLQLEREFAASGFEPRDRQPASPKRRQGGAGRRRRPAGVR